VAVNPHHIVNTSAVVAGDLTYEDDPPEIVHVIAAGDWCARLEGGVVPLVLWAIQDDGRAYGVVPGDDGRHVDLTEGNVEDRDDFKGYIKEK
jgi:hypothetical protein